MEKLPTINLVAPASHTSGPAPGSLSNPKQSSKEQGQYHNMVMPYFKE